LAVTSTGAVLAWGFNADGELGNGTTTNSNTPVPVSAPATSGITAIAAGNDYSLAIKAAPLTSAVAVSGSPSTATVNQPVTLSAMVTCTGAPAGQPAGTVQFFDNGVAINGTKPVVVAAGGGSGTATLTTSFSTAGTHPITAQYLPAAGSPCPGATSPVFNETITAVTSSTCTTLSASPTDPSVGQPVTAP
jgi:hypothetical protein